MQAVLRSFSNVIPSPGQQFSTDCCHMAHSSTGSVLQARPAPLRVPHRVTNSSKPAPACRAPPCRGLQVPARILLLHGLPMRSQLLLSIPSSGVGSCRCISAPLCPAWAARAHLLHPGLPHRASGDSAPGAAAALPFALTLVCAELFLSHILTPEMSPSFLLVSASSRSVLEPAGIGCAGHWESLWQLLTEPTLVATSLPKPDHATPAQRRRPGRGQRGI